MVRVRVRVRARARVGVRVRDRVRVRVRVRVWVRVGLHHLVRVRFGVGDRAAPSGYGLRVTRGVVGNVVG